MRVLEPVAWTPRRVMQVCSGNLLGQAFLDLGPACEVFDEAGQFGQAEDAVAGQVAEVGGADDGQHVVLAHRPDGDEKPGGGAFGFGELWAAGGGAPQDGRVIEGGEEAGWRRTQQ